MKNNMNFNYKATFKNTCFYEGYFFFFLQGLCIIFYLYFGLGKKGKDKKLEKTEVHKK